MPSGLAVDPEKLRYQHIPAVACHVPHLGILTSKLGRDVLVLLCLRVDDGQVRDVGHDGALVILDRVNVPPSQVLVPTCSIALTRPSTIGVLSGLSDGHASMAPLAISRTTAVDNSNKTAFLIPDAFSRREEEWTRQPTPLRKQRRRLDHLCDRHIC